MLWREAMKNKLAAVFLTIFLFGCGGPKEVDISKKQEKNGIVYVENEKKPFTGKIISKYENGQMKMDSQYKDGKLEGIVREYYKDGQIQNEWNYKDNHLDGDKKNTMKMVSYQVKNILRIISLMEYLKNIMKMVK